MKAAVGQPVKEKKGKGDLERKEAKNLFFSVDTSLLAGAHLGFLRVSFRLL